uniref:putative ribosomal protein PSRP-3/Ycf65 n=1 Tax=Euglena undulata TaxID=1685799 RepID=UPI0023AAACB2|nr:putative ribosomal protein PSRP-3/Ycf65 [Euglena undulata]WCH63409.1 putative ribosomal protein PSRP-3/Ycf65 [Euglena undulata]
MDRFILKFLWLDKSIAVCLDQKIGNRTNPLTEYFFWPQKDAWEEMKCFLESKTWITQNESVLLLNQITEVINCWQEKDSVNKKDISKLKENFPNSIFIGYN